MLANLFRWYAQLTCTLGANRLTIMYRKLYYWLDVAI